MPAKPLSVDVQVESPAWRKAWPKAAAEAKALVLKAARHPDLASKAKGVVAVVLASDARLQALNAQFRGKDKPTNVLSFPDSDVPLGGMALAFGTVETEAKGQNKPISVHAKHLILHGFLHLLGYDHDTTRAQRLMEGLEVAILADMGIPNPYVLKAKSRA